VSLEFCLHVRLLDTMSISFTLVLFEHRLAGFRSSGMVKFPDFSTRLLIPWKSCCISPPSLSAQYVCVERCLLLSFPGRFLDYIETVKSSTRARVVSVFELLAGVCLMRRPAKVFQAVRIHGTSCGKDKRTRRHVMMNLTILSLRCPLSR
jgi:hypothetical protein